MGFFDDVWDCVVIFGDVIYEELVKWLLGKVFKIGLDWDEVLYEGLVLDFVDIESVDFIICIGFDNYWNGCFEYYQ